MSAGLEVLLCVARRGSATQAARELPWAEQAASAIGHMRSELAGLEQAPVGTVHVALLHGLPSYLVTKGLAAFLAAHPGLALEFEPASAVVDP
jgi:DNA-binding transcriptional LysR family regulator